MFRWNLSIDPTGVLTSVVARFGLSNNPNTLLMFRTEGSVLSLSIEFFFAAECLQRYSFWTEHGALWITDLLLYEPCLCAQLRRSNVIVSRPLDYAFHHSRHLVPSLNDILSGSCISLIYTDQNHHSSACEITVPFIKSYGSYFCSQCEICCNDQALKHVIFHFHVVLPNNNLFLWTAITVKPPSSRLHRFVFVCHKQAECRGQNRLLQWLTILSINSIHRVLQVMYCLITSLAVFTGFFLFTSSCITMLLLARTTIRSWPFNVGRSSSTDTVRYNCASRGSSSTRSTQTMNKHSLILSSPCAKCFSKDLHTAFNARRAKQRHLPFGHLDVA